MEQAARKLGDRLLEASAFNNLGIVYHHIGDDDRALDFYQRGQVLYRQIEEPRFQTLSMVNIADIQRARGNYPQTLANSLGAAKILMEYGDKSAVAHRVAGNTYRDMNDTVQTMDGWERSVKMARKMGDRKNEVLALISIA